MKKITYTILVLLFSMTVFAQQTFTTYSPDQQIKLQVMVANTSITYSLMQSNQLLMDKSAISMTLANAVLGAQAKLSSSKTWKVDQLITSPFYKKQQIQDAYNALKLTFKGNYALQFRVYNSGIAYRFETTIKDSITVMDEQAEFRFATNETCYAAFSNTSPTAPIERQYANSFENWYEAKSLTETNQQRLIITPVLQQALHGRKMVITEANLMDYPGMFLQSMPNDLCLKARFAPCPKKVQQGGHNNLQFLVKERADFIAKTKGTRTFPWRVIAVSVSDKELANNDLVYLLADECQVPDVSWIKPGKVAWDWWNDWNITGVNFASGVNNATYKYYIDFAAKYGVEYVILDEGWAVNGKADMMQVVPEIDLKELIRYAREKNVGIVLWGGYAAMNKDMDGICKHYAEMGVKGFKVDFMDRDDQIIVNFYNQLAKVAAKYHLMIDFHGAFKPTGLQRTYPNVINYEGVAGLEQMKWAEKVDQMEYDVTLPFIRMVAGPMDYTQGAMRNATKENYAAIYSEPMSQGTRCHQLALYSIFDSPFNMLCDSPTNYEKEPACTRFIAQIPTIWHSTEVLDGKVGDYIVMARRFNTEWYIGAITDWNARDISIDFRFLGEGNFTMQLFKDGVNAHRNASDFSMQTMDLPADKKLKVHLAPGGGFTARITRK